LDEAHPSSKTLLGQEIMFLKKLKTQHTLAAELVLLQQTLRPDVGKRHLPSTPLNLTGNITKANQRRSVKFFVQLSMLAAYQ
jgi:hypothetical protein